MTLDPGNEPEHPIDLPLSQAKELTDKIQARLFEYLETVSDQPAWANDQRDELPALEEGLPREPKPLDETLSLLFDKAIPCSLNTGGPGYLAYIPGGGIYSAALAEMIAATVNRYANVWEAAPGAAKIERVAISWLVEALGLPSSISGVFTSGGSMSNLLAVAAARDKCGEPVEKLVTYCATEVHYSMDKAARLAGFRPDHVRSVPVDENLRIRVDVLADMIRADRASGLVPCFICGSAGTVNTGIVDPLRELAALARSEEMWLHVDGAYGGVFHMLEELRPVFDGIELADSVAIDPHKGLFVAYGTGVLLVQDLADLRRSFGDHASYLPSRSLSDDEPDYFELTPELSRGWRGVRVWLPFRLHGFQAFEDAIREKRTLALDLWDAVTSEPDVEALGPPPLSLFAFRQTFEGLSLEEENARNRQLHEAINSERRIFLTPTTIDGKFWIRAVVLHFRTHRDRIDEAIDIIRRSLAKGRE